MKVAMIGIMHHVDDDRIYHKEALSLVGSGYEVTIIARNRISKALNSSNGIKFIEVKGGILKRLLSAIIKGLKENADVYHVHDMESLVVGAFVKLLKPKSKLIWDVHEYYPDMIPLSNSLKGKFFLFFMCYMLEPVLSRFFINAIITADSDTAVRYLKWNNRTFVVHNYVEFKHSQSKVSKFPFNNNSFNNFNNSMLGSPVLVYVGGISKDRGSEFLINIANIVKNLGGSLVLAGPVKDDISKRLINHRGVVYLGHVPHETIPLILQRGHIGLIPLKEVPKYHKNLPIKLFEYLSSGLPVISSRLKATCKYIIENNVGRCIHYGNIQEFFEAILEIMSNYVRYKRNCLKTYKRYLWRYECHKLLGVYRYIVGGE